MSRNRILSIFMAVIMLLTTAVYAAPEDEGTDEAVAAVPRVTVVCSNIDNAGEYLEIGLEITAQEFQTVGVVLSYDSDVLTLIEWGTQETDTKIPVTGNWTTVVPTKGADDMSGKPGLATRPASQVASGGDDEQEETSHRAYLYLGADRLQFAQALTEQRVVTARFAIEDVAALNLLTEFSAEADLTDETYTVCLAENADILKTSKPGASVLVTTKKTETELNKYTYGIVVSADKGQTCAVSFKTGTDSINTGGTTQLPSGDYSITFFDWDGRVIDAISSPEDGTDAVKFWQESQNVKDRLGNKAGYAFNEWLAVYQPTDGRDLQTVHGSLTSVKAAESTPADATVSSAAKLYKQDTFAGNGGDLEQISTAALAAKVNQAGGANNASAGSATAVLLQASYRTITGDADPDVDPSKYVNNGHGDVPTSGLGEDYTRYQFGIPTFYQYGNAGAETGQYAVRCTVERNGTLRGDTPVVMAVVSVRAGTTTRNVTVKVDLENTDNTSFEVVVPKGITQISYKVLDSYGLVDWTNGVGRSQEKAVKKEVVVQMGAFALLADTALAVKNGGGWGDANVQCFQDAGYAKVNEGNLAAARTALLSAVTGDTPPTRAQVNSALSGYYTTAPIDPADPTNP